MSYELHCVDSVEFLKALPDSGVNLAVWDPPYYRYKDLAWDRQWETESEYIQWIGSILKELTRVLTPNGSNYMFCSDRMLAPLEMETRKHFNVLNRIAWAKRGSEKHNSGQWSRMNKDSLRAFFPQTEYIIFSEQLNADSMALGESGYTAQCEKLRGFVFEPLRAYFAAEKERAGVSTTQIISWFESRGLPKYVTARHTFTQSQWELPTEENYHALRQCFEELGNHSDDYLRREYEYLRREYEDLRREYEDLRQPFAITSDVPYTDVWTFPVIQHYEGKHPCEKPYDLFARIIKASSREGDTVLDLFMGTGNSGLAAVSLGRDYIGIDLQEKWVNTARRKLDKLNGNGIKCAKTSVKSLPLFS